MSAKQLKSAYKSLFLNVVFALSRIYQFLYISVSFVSIHFIILRRGAWTLFLLR